jgi:hypothetical protein
MIKVCTTCGADKPIVDFPKNVRMSDGHLNACKPCEYARVKAWRCANPERVKESNAAMRFALIPAGVTQSCKNCHVEMVLSAFRPSRGMKLGVRKTCRPCESILTMQDENHADRTAKWIKNNSARAREIQIASYQKHKKKRLEYRKEWRAANLDRDKQREKSYLKNNRPIVYAKNARRRAAETQAAPLWLTWVHKAQIQEFYEIADARKMQTGDKHHVDHIVPLRGDGVLGLHVPWNLQVLTEFENCSKHNKMLDTRI